MHFGLILTTGAHTFPHKWHRIEPQDVYAMVCQVKYNIGYFPKNSRFPIVEIPRKMVKRRPDPFAGASNLRIPCKVTGRKSGKNLA